MLHMSERDQQWRLGPSLGFGSFQQIENSLVANGKTT